MRAIWVLAAGAVIALTTPATGEAFEPAFNPSKLKLKATTQANEVLVLGSPHLSGWPEGLKTSALAPMLDRLAAWKPQSIAVEAVSGADCDMMRRYPARYSDSVDSYCWDPEIARKATGLDVAAATAEVERLLSSWPETPVPAQRRRLAATFLAGGEQASALVQWLRLSPEERTTGDGLDQALVERLEKLRARQNENYLIAAPLAARLGLERVYSIDDHTSDRKIVDEKAFAAAMTAAWDNPVAAMRRAKDQELGKGATTGSAILAAYRYYNGPEQAKLAYESDFGAALKDRSPERIGRRYVGYWETRNLRMAANVRDVLAEKPGQRMLVIVGASHKGYLDAYLQLMHDVQLADALRVL